MSRNENNAPPDLYSKTVGDKFYFQQRRGTLDIRSLSKINVEKVIADADVGVLQSFLENLTFCSIREEELKYLTDPLMLKLFRLAQLTIEYLLFAQEELVANLHGMAKKYSSKKRELVRKRKELLVTQESVEHLKGQIRIKRENIRTLETLLKEAARRKRKASVPEKTVSSLASSDDGDADDAKTFYIANSKGICIELRRTADCKISEIIDVASDRFGIRHLPETATAVRLIHKGKMLMSIDTVASVGIRNGDTIVAVSQTDGSDADDEVDDHSHPTRSGGQLDQKAVVREMLSDHKTALRDMTNEIRQGFEQSVEQLKGSKMPLNVPQQNDDMLITMTERWNQMETALRGQLDAQMISYQDRLEKLVKNKRRGSLVVGQLESDDDEVTIASKPALRGSFAVTAGFESEKALAAINDLHVEFKKQSEELEKLRREMERRELSKQSDNSPVQKQQLIVTRLPDHKSPTNHTKPVVTAVSKPPIQRVQGIHDTDQIFPELEAAPPAAYDESPAPLMIPKAINEVELFIDGQLSNDIVRFGKGAITLTVNADIVIDDLVFEIRKSVAEQLGVQLARVYLLYHNQAIVLGLDAAHPFSAIEAAEQFKHGHLLVKVNSEGKVLSDAQLDLLVSEWEQKNGTLANSVSIESSDGKWSSLRRLAESTHVDDLGSTAHDDNAPTENLQLFSRPSGQTKSKLDTIKLSLEDALSGVSDKEGLTDEELHEKMERLKVLKTSMSGDVSRNIETFRDSFSDRPMAAFIADSGSEDIDERRATSLSVSLTRGIVPDRLRLSKQSTNSSSAGFMLHSKRQRSFDDDSDDEANEQSGTGRAPPPTSYHQETLDGRLRSVADDQWDQSNDIGRRSETKDPNRTAASILSEDSMFRDSLDSASHHSRAQVARSRYAHDRYNEDEYGDGDRGLREIKQTHSGVQKSRSHENVVAFVNEEDAIDYASEQLLAKIQSQEYDSKPGLLATDRAASLANTASTSNMSSSLGLAYSSDGSSAWKFAHGVGSSTGNLSEMDWNRTIDSEGELLGKGRPKSEQAISRRVDEYEQVASIYTSPIVENNQKQLGHRGGGTAPSPNLSPFADMQRDTEGGDGDQNSLEISGSTTGSN